ncbi:MAG: GTPase HflX [Candidatus Kapaibacteriales bacterium]
MFETIVEPERALIITTPKKGTPREVIEEHIEELSALVSTAGAIPVDNIYQEIVAFHPATAIGRGKVEEIKKIIEEEKINLVVFDDELTPVQTRNLEREFQTKVIDRTTLILAIFARHARTLEAKTQVELAQLQYLLPRLTRLWTHLSKQYGGIGTKGPGETQIETDRRLVKARIQKLQDKLAEIDVQKQVERKLRSNFFRFALVGYTNAGKSTLMQALTGANILIENKLFATLDTTTRSLRLPNGKIVVVSDTVGFIRKLPTHLVASFRSTLAEARFSDALLHVADASHRFLAEQINVVENTLRDLNLHIKPCVLILNKIDLIQDKEYIRFLQSEYPNSILISAERNINILAVLEKLQNMMEENSKLVRIRLPYNKLNLVSRLYELSRIVDQYEMEDGIEFVTKLMPFKEKYFYHIFNNFILN